MPHLPLHPAVSMGGHDYPVFEADIPDAWQEIAAEKGFEIILRVRDRYHLALRHEACGALMVSKVFTLRTAQPMCQSCLDERRRDLCQAAGVEFLGRDNQPNYLRVRLPCGHETTRQQELLERVRRGETGIRCETCLGDRLAADARARGWDLIGPDPEDDPSYRLYRHDCGQIQRVAIANMTTGRFTCAGCSDGWLQDRSYIYLMRFVLQNGRDTIKLGFSRDPVSRLRHQLITDRDQYARLVRIVEIPTGREALRLEKRLHVALRGAYPDAVLDRGEFAGQVRVVSELYCARIEREIMRRLDALELRLRAVDRCSWRKARRHARRTRRARRHAGSPLLQRDEG